MTDRTKDSKRERHHDKQSQFGEKQKRNQNKRSRNKNKYKLVSVADFEFQTLRTELARDAKALQIPSGAAEKIANQVIQEAERWLDEAGKATLAELREKINTELAKYHADLAYVYQNRGKII